MTDSYGTKNEILFWYKIPIYFTFYINNGQESKTKQNKSKILSK